MLNVEKEKHNSILSVTLTLRILLLKITSNSKKQTNALEKTKEQDSPESLPQRLATSTAEAELTHKAVLVQSSYD